MAIRLATFIKNRKQFFVHSLIWMTLILGIVFFAYSEGRKITPTLFYRIGVGAFIFYMNYGVLVPRLLLQKKKFLYLISVILLLVVANFIITNIFPWEISEGIQGLRAPRFVAIAFFNSVIIILGTISRIYEQWIENDRIKTEIEAQKSKTELEALKNQLNPHFLFNSLNSIYSLTVKKSNDAPEAVIMLSELMRYMLYIANNDKVLLKDELQYVENYLQLQRMRIAKSENVKTSIKGAISAQKISPLLFISYIENAFKYGTDFNGNTDVSIDINVKEDELQFKCANLIGSRNKDEENSGIGLQNTKERLELLYPKKHWLTIAEKDNQFVVDLKLKLD